MATKTITAAEITVGDEIHTSPFRWPVHEVYPFADHIEIRTADGTQIIIKNLDSEVTVTA